MREFRIQDTDKRKEFISGNLERTQKLSGADVEYFSLETGFTLLERQARINYSQVAIRKAISAAKLSMGVPLELREFYYTLGATPELMEPFNSVRADMIYAQVLAAINNLEILCDIGRENFTVGNLSKGFIFYSHSEKYSDKDRKVGFTENIARQVMTADELNACQNIIVIEKNAAATRLVDLGFSELTNSVIVTVGGNFSRAIWELTSRFHGNKNMLFFADGDVYGVDMLRTIKVGTANSRHLDYKFPPVRYPSIHLIGLFPSIGKDLGLACDKDQKRPSARPATRKRIRFLVQHGLADERDVKAWLDDDLTYEMESLSTAYKNKKGEPVGLAIYLVEYMRLKGVPCKPPLPPDDELEKQFKEAALEELRREISEKTSLPGWFWDTYHELMGHQAKLIERIFNSLLPAYEKALDKITAKEIKYHIYKQFEQNPEMAKYDLALIAHKIKERFEIEVDWLLKEIGDRITEVLDDYEGPDFDTDAVFEPIHNSENYNPDEYDLVLKRLGVDAKDVIKVRQALEARFGE